MTGTSKVFVCTGDGTIRTFKEEAGGLDGKIPVANEDFTYTGEYEVLDDTDALGTWWRIKFKTSGKLIILKKFIGDIFLVGGGGSSGSYSYSSSSRSYSANLGGGGGGGYTKTEKSIEFPENSEYEIIIGDGGAANTATYCTTGYTGGSTSININDGISVSGGAGGININNGSKVGGAGGSGGGGGFYQYYGNENAISGSGGSDGGNGTRSSVYDVSGYSSSHNGGAGQGTTTREFGETFGDLYSGGGCGGVYLSASNASAGSGGSGGGGGINTSGTPNTGGGGGGPSNQNSSATGGSGILIIRNHRE